jgi:predicted house-cleaning NTP pyrophosphatase (Maf/HAM1 superfamily)
VQLLRRAHAYAAQVDGRRAQGDAAGAFALSQKARQFVTYSVIAGLLSTVVGLAVVCAVPNTLPR